MSMWREMGIGNVSEGVIIMVGHGTYSVKRHEEAEEHEDCRANSLLQLTF